MTDWKEKALAHWDEINSLAVRRFGEGVLAEEAALAVMDNLETDNWHRLRTFNKRASFTTFLRTLTVRLLEDFARKRFGRVRAPLWVRTFGGIWEKLFRALCLERLKVADAVEVVFQRQMTTGKSEIEDAAYQLLARIPGCGMDQGREIVYEEEKVRSGQNSGPHPDQSLEHKEKKEMFQALYQLVLGDQESLDSDALVEKFNNFHLDLSADEKLLLRLCYQDGMGVSQAGKMIGLNRFQAHGKMRRLLARLKNELERIGLDRDLRLFIAQ